MKSFLQTLIRLVILFALLIPIEVATAQVKAIHVDKDAMVFSAIKGSMGRPDTLILSAARNVRISDVKITGPGAAYFRLVSPKPKEVTSKLEVKIAIAFEPSSDFVGLAEATMELKGANISVALRGLSTQGLEGENEAPLSTIVATLGYQINVGWTTLANHAKPEIQGDELAPSLFKRALDGPVEIIPVARYSPDFLLNFGFYTNSPDGPRKSQTGILSKAGKYPEHQTLFPRLAKGSTSFNPGDKTFGFYATSPDHTLYSEDEWNMLLYPSRATHATRIYPVRDKSGKLIDNAYLLCMEEAANGDFNDYVFLVKNIKPIPVESEFISLTNGKNFDGWHKWFQSKGKDNDPENIFTIEQDGIIHDTGKELGYIITEQSFSNFHFRLEFKWGEKKWPPRENAKRDSGICYNIPEGEEDFIWPASIECQVQEGDVGDFWLLEYSTVQVDGKQNAPSNHTQIVKKKDAEKPTGQWNTVEVISFHGKCVHIVNGVVVNYGENASLVGGRILLQSEYAEVFYRNVVLRKL